MDWELSLLVMPRTSPPVPTALRHGGQGLDESLCMLSVTPLLLPGVPSAGTASKAPSGLVLQVLPTRRV